METISRCTGLLQRIQTVVEFNLGFISYEKRVFHLDMANMMTKLFPTSNDDILFKIADKVSALKIPATASISNWIIYLVVAFFVNKIYIMFNFLYHILLFQLLSLCITLGDKPNIRFHSNSIGVNQQLATIMHQKMSKLNVSVSEWVIECMTESVRVWSPIWWKLDIIVIVLFVISVINWRIFDTCLIL